MVSLAMSLFSEAIPCMDLWETLLGRPIDLYILEDNEATINIVNKGYSSKLRHCLRHHKINLGSVKEALDNNPIELVYCHTNFQAADIFTKALEPHKWDNALALLGIDTRRSDNTPELEDMNIKASTTSDEKEEASETLDQNCKAPQPAKGCIAACVAIDGVVQEVLNHCEVSEAAMVEKTAAQQVKDISKTAAVAKPRSSAKLTHWGNIIEIS